MAYRAAIRMVPGPLWKFNLRKGRVIPQSRWNKIRARVFDEYGLVCQISGIETERKRLHVHEEWEYLTDRKPALAKLSRLKISCRHCHMVEHFGALVNMVASGELTQQAIEDTVDHFCRINRVDRDAFRAHLADAKAEWMRLSQLEWEVDWGEYSAPVKGNSAETRAATATARRRMGRRT